MTDELTPEERDALENLPRERMPSAGLEDRVVGAMRAHGMLAPKQRGKVVRLTTGRAAGLLAASVVLVAGAYYIGQRGVGDDVIRNTPTTPSEISRMNEPGRVVPMREPEPGTAQKEKEAPAASPAPAGQTELQAMAEEKKELEWSLKDDADRTDAADAVEETVRESGTEGVAAQKGERMETRGGRGDQPPAPESATPGARMSNAAPALESGPVPRERSFTLAGSTLVVDAPDSIRITEEPDSRVVLIHTPGDPIRVRMADTDVRSGLARDQVVPMSMTRRSVALGGRRIMVDAPAGVRIVEEGEGRLLLIDPSGATIRIRLED